VRSLGGLWILAEGRGEMPGGAPATMLMTLGYDPAKNRFVGTWVGSMMTHLWVYQGWLNETGRGMSVNLKEAARQRLIAARREATARREALRREALDLRGTMLGEADAAAKRLVEQATAELQSERAREEQALAGRAAALAARISERLVGRAV